MWLQPTPRDPHKNVETSVWCTVHHIMIWRSTLNVGISGIWDRSRNLWHFKILSRILNPCEVGSLTLVWFVIITVRFSTVRQNLGTQKHKNVSSFNAVSAQQIWGLRCVLSIDHCQGHWWRQVNLELPMLRRYVYFFLIYLLNFESDLPTHVGNVFILWGKIFWRSAFLLSILVLLWYFWLE